MGTVKILFNDTWYQELTEGDNLGAFRKLLIGNNDIRTQLQNYHSDEDGAPIVPEFDIVWAVFDNQLNSGQIRFAYHVEFTFACADKRAETRHTETSNISTDAATKTLSVIIHDKISRDTFEEF